MVQFVPSHRNTVGHVCLMPFAINRATRCISPTKALDYMAARKPIVSTLVPDVVANWGDAVRIGADASGFVGAVELRPQALKADPPWLIVLSFVLGGSSLSRWTRQ